VAADWRIFAGLVVISFVGCAVLMKFSEGRVSTGLGILCFGLATFLAAAAFYAYEVYTGQPQHGSISGINILFWAGVLNLVGDLAFILALRYGAKLSTLSPFVDASAVVITALAAMLLFGEAISLIQAAGIMFAALGISLLVI
jgi:uncharacterized membrane protein